MPSQISVPGESEGLLTLEFLPLTTRVQTGKLELNNADLGVYLYELECTATPAGPEKALYFKCALGSHQTLSAKFSNYAKQKTEYTCKVSRCRRACRCGVVYCVKGCAASRMFRGPVCI